MLLAFHLGCVCIFALHNTCLWHIFYSGAVHRKLFVTSDVLCSVFPLCVRMYETCRLSTIQLPNFARRLKQKEVQIFTRDLPPPLSPFSPSPPPNNHSNKAVANFPGSARVHCRSQLGRLRFYACRHPSSAAVQ